MYLIFFQKHRETIVLFYGLGFVISLIYFKKVLVRHNDWKNDVTTAVYFWSTNHCELELHKLLNENQKDCLSDNLIIDLCKYRFIQCFPYKTFLVVPVSVSYCFTEQQVAIRNSFLSGSERPWRISRSIKKLWIPSVIKQFAASLISYGNWGELGSRSEGWKFE